MLESLGGERILPVFYDDNYVTILAGETVMISLEFRVNPRQAQPLIFVEGWNTDVRGGGSLVPVKWR